MTHQTRYFVHEGIAVLAQAYQRISSMSVRKIASWYRLSFVILAVVSLWSPKPALAFTPFDCAAARMSADSGHSIKDYYGELYSRCGCDGASTIPLCDWLKLRIDATRDKEIVKPKNN